MPVSGMLAELRFRRDVLNESIRDLERLAEIRKSSSHKTMEAVLRDLRWERQEIDQALGALERLMRYVRNKHGRRPPRIEPASRGAGGVRSSRRE